MSTGVLLIDNFPDEIRRCIVSYTDPGFVPFKRVCRWFKSIENSPARLNAVKEKSLKREKKLETASPAQRPRRRKLLRRLDYVTSAELTKWSRDEMQMPIDSYTCAAAAYEGYLDALRWLRAQDPPCPWDVSVCTFAAFGGHLEVLQWLRVQDPPCPWDQGVCRYATVNGHLEVLQWARAQDPPCPWNKWVCRYATQNGHQEVLQWLQSQNLPRDWF